MHPYTINSRIEFMPNFIDIPFTSSMYIYDIYTFTFGLYLPPYSIVTKDDRTALQTAIVDY